MKKIIFVFTLLISTRLFAEEPRLKTLMAIMGGQAHAMLSGMLYGNYEPIIDAVEWVNNHEQPTADMAIIKKELGVEAIRFKWFDTQTHNAANAMGRAAANRDMKGVAQQYAKMIVSCNKCHEAYRDRLRIVLHPQE